MTVRDNVTTSDPKLHDSLKSYCVQHPPLPYVAIRPEYLSICDGNPCAAALLSFFEHWHNVKLDAREQARKKNEIARRYNLSPDQDEDLWVYESQDELRAALLNVFSVRNIRTSLKLLGARGYLETRRNPKHQWDRTVQYLFRPEQVQCDLDAWWEPHRQTRGRSVPFKEDDPSQAIPDHSLPDHSFGLLGNQENLPQKGIQDTGIQDTYVDHESEDQPGIPACSSSTGGDKPFPSKPALVTASKPNEESATERVVLPSKQKPIPKDDGFAAQASTQRSSEGSNLLRGADPLGTIARQVAQEYGFKPWGIKRAAQYYPGGEKELRAHVKWYRSQYPKREFLPVQADKLRAEINAWRVAGSPGYGPEMVYKPDPFCERCDGEGYLPVREGQVVPRSEWRWNDSLAQCTCWQRWEKPVWEALKQKKEALDEAQRVRHQAAKHNMPLPAGMSGVVA